MDIRKWLTAPKPNSASSSTTGQSKSDAKSKKSETDRKKSEKVGKKRRIIESDSDEDPIPKEIRDSSSKKSPQKKSSSSKPVEKQKEVSVSDFFGSAPVSRSHKPEPAKKKKLNEIVVVHDDDDFEATLSQLDKQPTKKHKGINGKTKAPSEKESKDTKTESTKVKTQETPPSKKVSTESEEKPLSKKKVSAESQENPPSKKANADSKEKTSPKGEKKSSEKGKASSKRKAVNESLVKMEIIPNPKKTTPKAEKIEIKEDKPAVKKPRASGGANYASYLNREGPKALGSKEIPEGEEGCFAGLTFLITGVLESLERDEAKALIEKYGGKVMSTLSKNTKYLVVGRDAGSSKLSKAESLGTKQVDEDGLLDLIRTLPGKGGSTKKPKSSVENKKSGESKTTPSSKKSSEDANRLNTSSIEDEFEMDLGDDDLFDMDLSCGDSASTKTKKSDEKQSEMKSPIKSKEKLESPKEVTKAEKDIKSSTTDLPTSMWVDKYKPSSLKQIIGQQGDNSNAKKLLRWLLNWHKSRKLNKKPVFGRFNPSDDGSAYKAALLSGPPGVGKTTTTVLVCKEAGFDYFELNASDTRSKKNLQQAVSQLLGNQTLGNCFKDNGGGKVTENHVIVMDEVDGMAGNEDRGGMGELIAFIKASKVPIICICNDRNHPKIRSLSNHCFDLRFQRPRVEQIKAAMMSIAFKEKIQVSQEVLQDVIVASNQDIRQVLHNMSMWSAKAKGLSSDQTKSDIGRGTKHIKMGPFDVLREVFAIGNKPNASIIDKSDLFFHDYSIAPLFVQENYVHVIPTDAQGDKHKHLSLLSAAADSICIGDVIEKQIRSRSSWGLLPAQAIFSSVVPGELLKGHLKQMINFPAWLGKNSNRNHMDRVLQELHVHMRMKVTGNKTDIALEYLPLMKRALTKPLVDDEQAGVPQVLKTMEEYYLLREDFDSIIELSLWSGQIDPRTKIQTKVKSAFTRAYNKECGKNPYSVTNVKKKKGSVKEETELGEEDAVESEEEEDDSIEKDAMIKVKKPSKKESAAASGEPSTSSGKKKAASSKKGKSK